MRLKIAKSVLIILWVWSFFVLCCYNPWPVWLRSIIGVGWVVALPSGRKRLPGHKWAVGFAAVAVVFLLWLISRPSNDRDWQDEHGQMVTAEFADGTATVRNYRYTTFDVWKKGTVTWQEKTYDLNKIERMDFIIVPIAMWRGIAHTFVTFGFEDGEYVAISVESRREKGEEYSAIRGLFKKYEIIYVAGDERDLLGSRANVHGHPVYLFPVKAEPEGIRALFVAMLNRANKLAEKPEFYHTLRKNCTTSIVRHVEDLKGIDEPFDLRIVFPGFAAGLLHEKDLIEVGGIKPSSWEEYLIPGDVSLELSSKEWSAGIRK